MEESNNNTPSLWSILKVLNAIVLILLYGIILYNKFVNNVNPDNFAIFTALTCLFVAFSEKD